MEAERKKQEERGDLTARLVGAMAGRRGAMGASSDEDSDSDSDWGSPAKPAKPTKPARTPASVLYLPCKYIRFNAPIKNDECGTALRKDKKLSESNYPVVATQCFGRQDVAILINTFGVLPQVG